jgi:hypothetical protein
MLEAFRHLGSLCNGLIVRVRDSDVSYLTIIQVIGTIPPPPGNHTRIFCPCSGRSRKMIICPGLPIPVFPDPWLPLQIPENYKRIPAGTGPCSDAKKMRFLQTIYPPSKYAASTGLL